MKGLQFRLYTEALDINRIINYATVKGLKNFTCIDATGKYNGVSEETLIIEYITPIDNPFIIDRTRRIFKDISDRIKKFNNQECVLLTEQPINFELY